MEDYDKPTEKITKPPEWEGAGAAVLRNIWGELYVPDQMDKILDKVVQTVSLKGRCERRLADVYGISVSRLPWFV